MSNAAPQAARRSFTKLLVANRGEIACRVMRTARALGYRTVAVYSEADAAAPHVALADEAVCIGPPPAAESYLHIPALLDAARRTAADAVHPGYGFLSERADFAEACEAAGLVFIGPPAEAIRAMGDKADAKRRMRAAGVPCAPGHLPEPGDADGQTETRLADEAARLGYPLLVKAVAGGGGRGMRLVHAPSELPEALAGARREAQSAFGDGTLMLERLVRDGRHIEVQVFADAHGHTVHLGERDCTAQRRRQKVIEEAPSPIVNAEMRHTLGAHAVAAAQAVGYVGAGTVEFIVDAQGQPFFLEMNTRLQVEHPVTECLTGFDLVAWQLRVAAGEPLSTWLPGGQADVRFHGHAIEARLYAEDPYASFQPQTGRLLHWQPAAAIAASTAPGQRPSLRVDDGVREGGFVSPWYDAMVAKLIVHGHDRDDARRRLIAALQDSPLLGLPTNRRFLADLLAHEDFAEGRMSTTRLDEWAEAGDAPLLQRPAPDDAQWTLAAALHAWLALPAGTPPHAGWRSPSVAAQPLTLLCQGEQRRLRVALSGDEAVVQLDPPAGAKGVAQDGKVRHSLRCLAREGAHWRVQQAGVSRRVMALHDEQGRLHLSPLGAGSADFVFTEPTAATRAAAALDPAQLRSPVAGTVARVAVQVGDLVQPGQPLVCVEAMKMELWQHATAAGTVAAVHVQPRSTVAAGALLVQLTLEEKA